MNQINFASLNVYHAAFPFSLSALPRPLLCTRLDCLPLSQAIFLLLRLLLLLFFSRTFLFYSPHWPRTVVIVALPFLFPFSFSSPPFGQLNRIVFVLSVTLGTHDAITFWGNYAEFRCAVAFVRSEFIKTGLAIR